MQLLPAYWVPSMLDLIQETADDLAAARRPASKLAVRRVLAKALKLPARPSPVAHRVLRPRDCKAETLQTYALASEPLIEAMVTLPHTAAGAFRVPDGKDCTLYVSHLNAVEELQTPAIRKALGNDRIFGLDVRGIGI